MCMSRRRASVCQLPMSHVSEGTAAPRARSLSSLPPRAGFTDVSKEAVRRPKSAMHASKSKYKTNPDPKSEFVGKPHTKSESAKDPHPTTESKPRKQTPRPKSATIKSEINFNSKEKLSKPRPLSSSDIASERARKIKEKLAAAGWESKKTSDGRVFYFHRAEQRFVVFCISQVCLSIGDLFFHCEFRGLSCCTFACWMTMMMQL